MPICKICGKSVQNPNSQSHTDSKYHQEKLKSTEASGNSLLLEGKKSKQVNKIKKAQTKTDSTQFEQINNELNEIKAFLLKVEKRVSQIEANLNYDLIHNKSAIKEVKTKIFKDEIAFKREIVVVINNSAELERVKGNIPLKTLKTIFIKEYDMTEKEFEEQILNLYRKQMIDLQPGGDPSEYHVQSPTGKKFYYLILKN